MKSSETNNISIKTCFVITLLLVILTNIGCFGSANFRFIDPEYKKKDLSDVSLLALTLNSEILSSEKQSELLNIMTPQSNKFSQKELIFFNQRMGRCLAESAEIKTVGIDPQFKPANIKYKYEKFTKNGEPAFGMIVPDSGKVQYHNFIPDFVIFFEDYFVEKDYSEQREIFFTVAKDFSMKSGIEYLIWDNNRQKIAAYGKIVNSRTILGFPQEETYVRVFYHFAELIIRNSPFKQKYDIY